MECGDYLRRLLGNPVLIPVVIEWEIRLPKPYLAFGYRQFARMLSERLLYLGAGFGVRRRCLCVAGRRRASSFFDISRAGTIATVEVSRCPIGKLALCSDSLQWVIEMTVGISVSLLKHCY